MQTAEYEAIRPRTEEEAAFKVVDGSLFFVEQESPNPAELQEELRRAMRNFREVREHLSAESQRLFQQRIDSVRDQIEMNMGGDNMFDDEIDTAERSRPKEVRGSTFDDRFSHSSQRKTYRAPSEERALYPPLSSRSLRIDPPDDYLSSLNRDEGDSFERKTYYPSSERLFSENGAPNVVPNNSFNKNSSKTNYLDAYLSKFNGADKRAKRNTPAQEWNRIKGEYSRYDMEIDEWERFDRIPGRRYIFDPRDDGTYLYYGNRNVLFAPATRKHTIQTIRGRKRKLDAFAFMCEVEKILKTFGYRECTFEEKEAFFRPPEASLWRKLVSLCRLNADDLPRFKNS